MTTEQGLFFFATLLLLLISNGILLWLRLRDRSQYQVREQDRKNAFELELSQQKRLLTETQSIAKLGSWEWDIGKDKIHWSPQLFEIFGVDPNNFDSSYAAYLARLSPEHRDKIKASVENARKTGESYSFEHSVTHTDGSTHYIQSRGVAIRNAEGEIVKLMGTCQDTTQQKKIEQELVDSHGELEMRVRERTQQLWEALERERMAKEAKMNFLANMSHEIRTPMNAILGFSDLLLTQEEDAAKKGLLLRIKTNGDHLLQLIDDILDLSKFEAGRIPVEKVDLHLPHLIQDVVNSVSGLSERRGLKIKTVYESALPETVKTDALRIRQILTNLLSNAIKFSEEGTITVRVSQFEKPFARKTSLLSLEVEDTGIGISDDDQRKLFQPFTQGDSSGTRRFGGTGLGLALSRHIARALDGELILVRSEIGKGSCFRLTMELGEMPMPRQIALIGPGSDLDFTPGTIALATKSAHAEVDHSPTLPPCRILLAEDSPDNEDLIRMYLKFEGVHIDSVQNGHDAIRLALENNYDLVLMDVQMPELDGLEATRRLRSRGYARPIVALTAHAMIEDRDRSLKAGCSAHVTKPVQRLELIHVIQEELHSTGESSLYTPHAEL